MMNHDWSGSSIPVIFWGYTFPELWILLWQAHKISNWFRSSWVIAAPLIKILSVGRSLMVDMEDNVSKSMGAFGSAVAQLDNALAAQDNIQALSYESSAQAQAANLQLQLLTNSSTQAQLNAQQARSNLSATLANAATAQEQANSAQNVLLQLTAEAQEQRGNYCGHDI